MRIGRVATLMAVTGLVALMVVILPVCSINGVGRVGEAEEGMHGDEIYKDGIEMHKRGDIYINFGRKDGDETYQEGVLPSEEYGERDVPAAARREVGRCVVPVISFIP